MKTLRLIMGDQLTHGLASLRNIDKSSDVIVMFELLEEIKHIKHHKKKVALILSSMRHFAEELKDLGLHVHYTTYDDPNNTHNFIQEIERISKIYQTQRLVITEPSEYRVKQMFLEWQNEANFNLNILDDDRFLCSHSKFYDWAKRRKQLRMEYFYRMMRIEHNILVSNGKPVGGKWNFDHLNRQSPKNMPQIPVPFSVKPDQITQDVLNLVSNVCSSHFGDLEPFELAVTAQQAYKALMLFIKHRLPNFGDFQDVMIVNQPFIFHSAISFYLNIGLLTPLQCINAVLDAYYKNKAPLNAVEGFIRQILGWREYIRGIYWLKMPSYVEQNYFNLNLELPELYWTAKTKMLCLQDSIISTKRHAYAHHIQRLMILGNFALLIGVKPKAINHWFYVVYADAFEWVEMPNVLGMAMFADGGLLASKPYISSGNYINKMSNYCGNCPYNIKSKTGDNACPFNYLYWNFIAVHKDKLSSNHRMSLILNAYKKLPDDRKVEIKQDAERFIASLY